MAQISKPQITQRLYRHFAVVTVVMALALAFLTGNEDGDRSGASAATVNRPAAPVAPRPSPVSSPAYGQAQLVSTTGMGSFGEEAAPSPWQRNRESRDTGPINPSDLPPANSENAGFTRAYLDSLSDEELEALLEAMRQGGITDDSQRRAASAVLEATSRRRSGQRIPQE